MARISFSQEGFSPFQQLLGHNKHILEKWSSLDDCLFNSPTFPAELKEEVRRRLAFNNGCHYCMAKGKPSDQNQITNSKILIATEIADTVSKNHPITEESFHKLKMAFTNAEISELLAFICFVTASQKFGALLELQPSCPI
ncbi:carboxymuconolactone decarboxylase family protein [Alkaliphilus transvaalensis]|uniref:carboxymuconolactone decarboxylase family protein n=1 Tax=Alkaliphilus transvaalensis TaxID=114628 RepID=UPI00047AC72C|nr:carboxymuconolactone decarboxylase family protein [Alkaliphilus transvaalensis]